MGLAGKVKEMIENAKRQQDQKEWEDQKIKEIIGGEEEEKDPEKQNERRFSIKKKMHLLRRNTKEAFIT